jgi:hypothetical protein
MKKPTETFKKHLSNYQLTGVTPDAKSYNSHYLNSYQMMLYNRALYGVEAYTKEERLKLNVLKRKRITKVHRKAINVLNVWKQQLVNVFTTNFFEQFFPKTEFTKEFKDLNADTDSELIISISFESLGITREQVIDKLMREGLLPKNFYNLKIQENAN